MLSVGIFTYSTKPRGSVVHAACLAEALTRAGHDTTLYALGKPNEPFYRKVSCKLRILPAQAAPAEMDALIRQRIGELTSGLERLEPQHHVFHAEDCLVGNALLESRGVLFDAPVVRTVHHVERFESPYLAACQRRTIEEADLVLAVSAVTRADVLREFGRDARCVRNGLDLDRFRTRDQATIRAVRARLGVSPSDVIILGVGGVEPRKNSLRALEAMVEVLSFNPAVHYVVAGGASIWDHDPYRARYRERLQTLPEKLTRRIHVTGIVEEDTLTALYQTARALLFPSEQEGWGLAAQEALAARTPVILPEEPPFTEYLDRRSARFVQKDSAEDISRAVTELVRNDALAAALGAAGEIRVRGFSWDATARSHASLYRALVTRLPGAARGVPRARVHGV